MKAVLLLLALVILVSTGGSVVVEHRLDNGVRIIVKETKGKGIVSGVVFFKGGQKGEEKAGVTHLLFTLLLKGSKRFPSSYEVSLPFEKYGGYIYSSSADDFSEIGFSTKVEGLDEALEVLEDVIKNPLLREEDLERERKNAIIAIRSKRERGMEFAMEHLRRLTYKGTPYETSPLGTEESVKGITREDLLKRLDQIRRGGNIVVSVVGDLEAEEVIERISSIFEDLPPGGLAEEGILNPIKEDKVVRVKREGTQATILCAFNGPPKDSEDYFAFKVLASVLGDGMTSKLFAELREKRGYAYATYAFYPTRVHSPRLFAYIGTSPEKKEEALRDLIAIIRNSDITEEDVDIAKNKIVGDFLLDHQTRIRQAWYLGFYEVMGLGWRMDAEYPDRIREVTLEEVKAVAKEYINRYHCVVVEP